MRSKILSALPFLMLFLLLSISKSANYTSIYFPFSSCKDLYVVIACREKIDNEEFYLTPNCSIEYKGYNYMIYSCNCSDGYVLNYTSSYDKEDKNECDTILIYYHLTNTSEEKHIYTNVTSRNKLLEFVGFLFYASGFIFIAILIIVLLIYIIEEWKKRRNVLIYIIFLIYTLITAYACILNDDYLLFDILIPMLPILVIISLLLIPKSKTK